ncbi:unnamed protein product [Pleuronectes platessa]|uniref:Uncharacterized protein n=1 Tax=Pleuronectes platessa TaxID=8262 RepID=A0A9N7UIQ9_PLEPL|nr:unnamed protein product [Pleuronectes platessa]
MNVVIYTGTAAVWISPKHNRESHLSTSIKTSTSDGFPNIRWHQSADVGFVPNPRMPRTFMALDLPDESSPYHTIHPRYKRDIAYRLSLGARAVAYNETDVNFLGPFPNQTLCSGRHVNITYDQAVSVTSSYDVFEIGVRVIQNFCQTFIH